MYTGRRYRTDRKDEWTSPWTREAVPGFPGPPGRFPSAPGRRGVDGGPPPRQAAEGTVWAGLRPLPAV